MDAIKALAAKIDVAEFQHFDALETGAITDLNDLELAYVGGGTGDVCF